MKRRLNLENGELPERIDSSALNTWVFNEDTMKQVLHILMRDGLKVDYGQKIGKTIILQRTMNMRRRYWKYSISNIRNLAGTDSLCKGN